MTQNEKTANQQPNALSVRRVSEPPVWHYIIDLNSVTPAGLLLSLRDAALLSVQLDQLSYRRIELDWVELSWRQWQGSLQYSRNPFNG